MFKLHSLGCRRHGREPEFEVCQGTLEAPEGAQVLVEVTASAVNALDVRRSQGRGRRLLDGLGGSRQVVVLGNDFAGVVRAVGRDVAGLRPGQRVFGLLPPHLSGTHATAVLADAPWVRPAPLQYTSAELATLPLTFTTVARALIAAGLDGPRLDGRHVLVNGAATTLGVLAVQLLAARGARVTAILSRREQDRFAHLPVDVAVTHRAMPFPRLAPLYDATLNFGRWSDEPALLALLAPCASGHATTAFPLLDNIDQMGWFRGLGRSAMDYGMHRRWLKERCPEAVYRWVAARPDGAALDQLHSLLVMGRLHVDLALEVSMPAAGDAFRHVRERRPGRAVMLPSPQASADIDARILRRRARRDRQDTLRRSRAAMSASPESLRTGAPHH